VFPRKGRANHRLLTFPAGGSRLPPNPTGIKDDTETLGTARSKSVVERSPKLAFWRKGQPDRIEGLRGNQFAPRAAFQPAKNAQLPMNETGLIVTLDGVQESTADQSLDETRVNSRSRWRTFRLASGVCSWKGRPMSSGSRSATN